MRTVGGLEALPEAGAERAVVDGAADLEQPIGTAPRTPRLLRFVHATIDEEVGRSLGQRRANPQPGPVPFAVVDQPIALPDEVAVQRLQRSPQLARGRDGSAAAGLATEVMHHRADAIDADLRILGLAIPPPPAQALDLLDDHRLRGRALRTIGGDRVVAVVLDPAGHATAAALRAVHGMGPGLRGDNLPLDAGQELLALGQAQTQGAQIGKGIGLGDPHDIGAVFFALSSDADQPHDPGHVVSTSAEYRPENTSSGLAPPISRQSRSRVSSTSATSPAPTARHPAF